MGRLRLFMVADGARGGPLLRLEASDNSVLSHGQRRHAQARV